MAQRFTLWLYPLFFILALAASVVSQAADHAVPASVVVATIDEYNSLQKSRSFDTPMLLEHQGARNTCVFHQVRSALHALGRPVIDEATYVAQNKKLEDVPFADAVETAGIRASHYEGGLIGSFKNLFNISSPFKGNDSLFQLVEMGVDGGRIVIVGLNSKVLHKALARKMGLTVVSGGGPHAVRVLGLHRTLDGSVDKVYLYDSAAPPNGMRYAISYQDFKDALKSMNLFNRLNRGVYVSAEAVFPAIVQHQH